MKTIDDSKRLRVFTVRMTNAQIAKLKRNAKKQHKTPSQFIRDWIDL